MLARGILRDIGVGLNITVTPGILRLRGVVLIGTVNSGILRDAGVALNISQSWLSTTGVKQQGRAGMKIPNQDPEVGSPPKWGCWPCRDRWSGP
jgi:hypothetical protein